MQRFPLLIEDTAIRQLLWALLMSLALHCFVLWKFGAFAADHKKTEPMPLTVRFLAPTPVSAVVADFPRDPATPPISGVNTIATPRIETPDQRSVRQHPKPAVVESPSHRESVAKTRAGNLPMPVVPMVAEAPAAPLEKPLQADRSPGIPLPGVTIPVKHAEIEFSMYSGQGRQPIGNVRHSFKSEVTETGEYYSLSIANASAEPTSDALDEWKMSVGGRISDNGLVARRYRVQGAGAVRLFALREVPQTALKSELRGATADGLLDRQSLLYHFSQQPPSFKGGGVWLADNSAQIYFEYRVVGIEEIQLPGIGPVRTTRVLLFHSPGGESIELWLAPDYRYLPVRVKHTDSKGTITEQFASSITVQ